MCVYQRIMRPLFPNDWTAFLKLATYVKALKPPLMIESMLGRDALQALAVHRPQIILFPNLRHLNHWALGASHEYLPEFLAMVGPQLSHIRMESFFTPDKLRQSLISVTGFTRLREFAVGAHHEDGNLQHMPNPLDLSSAWITACPLTRFECDKLALAEGAIRALSTVQTLTHLHVRLPPTSKFSLIHSSDRPFLSLQLLKIVATPKAYVSFTDAVGAFSNVCDFELHLDPEPANSVSPRRLFASMASSLNPETITIILVCAHDENGTLDPSDLSIDEPIPFSSEDFRPLLKLKNLQDVNIALPWVFDFDDAFITEVAQSWPMLYTFYLGTEPYCKWAPLPRGLTLGALPPFAVHCEYMEELGFRFNATGFEHGIPPDSPLYGKLRDVSSCSRSALSSLHVATSPISHTAEVASFLSCVFPELEKVVTGTFASAPAHADALSFKERWEELSRYLPAMRVIRNNERKRAELDEHDGWMDEERDAAEDELVPVEMLID